MRKLVKTYNSLLITLLYSERIRKDWARQRSIAGLPANFESTIFSFNKSLVLVVCIFSTNESYSRKMSSSSESGVSLVSRSKKRKIDVI